MNDAKDFYFVQFVRQHFWIHSMFNFKFSMYFSIFVVIFKAQILNVFHFEII